MRSLAVYSSLTMLILVTTAWTSFDETRIQDQSPDIGIGPSYQVQVFSPLGSFLQAAISTPESSESYPAPENTSSNPGLVLGAIVIVTIIIGGVAIHSLSTRKRLT
jgi:hypothetical protein